MSSHPSTFSIPNGFNISSDKSLLWYAGNKNKFSAYLKFFTPSSILQ